ncbi:DUF2855 family protein [Amycolatopsis sp. BJA-103]|uniref:DUF2855 family protein n=1 Tax=Amycolatopsis sp. BJA-103 TaxID=1911175 RepID=UPI000C76441D|nr:DUF2855 family protein [Amycolatopsis sp. BJA-103]AUI61794.1 hypothetical protein BKN51_28950 [Amycolatopsis sp. BJA-103]PNE20908.1 hypothetical protein B1H26_03495 [Amycolatopsis sp. BJA-103]
MPTREKWEVLVRRNDIAASEIRVPILGELQPGEVRLEIEKFGLTANNVSYAKFGDGNIIPFWNAFPGPPEFGRVPLWGFVRVAESRNADIPVGSRYFGYVPMASHHTVQAEATPRGFLDKSPQRGFLHPWYLTFQHAGEPDDLDDFRALMRPVFPASFNLAGLVERQAALGAKSLIVTSASCKTAIGMVDELRERQVDIAATAITSSGNKEFVESLGIYDEVVAYDAIESATVTAPAVLVDFTGAAKLLHAVYQEFAPSLSCGVLIGFNHPDPGDQAPAGLPDPQPELFFTPMVEDQAIAEEGADAYYSRYHESETRFLRRMASWLGIRHGQGPAEVADAFRCLLTGDQAPDVGRVLTP